MPEPDDNPTTPPAGQGQPDMSTRHSAATPGDGQPPETLQLTQDRLTRLLASEKDQGRRAAQRELLEQLGVETLDQAKAVLQREKEAEDARKTEAERLAEQARQDRAQAQADREAARQELLDSRVRAALIASGVEDGEDLGDLVGLVKATSDDDSGTIREKVDALRQRRPGLFTTAGPQDGFTPAPTGRGTGTPPARHQQGTGDAYTRGAERAKALGLTGTPA